MRWQNEKNRLFLKLIPEKEWGMVYLPKRQKGIYHVKEKIVLRKVLSVIMAVIIMQSMVVCSFAEEIPEVGLQEQDTAVSYDIDEVVYHEEISDAKEVIERLNAIDYGTEVTFTKLPMEMDNETLLEFDSVEEAEAYLRQMFKEREETLKSVDTSPLIIGEITDVMSSNKASKKVKDGWKYSTVSWWGGGSTSLFFRTNAMLSFYYRNGKISSITVNDSYMTGIVGATWTHRSGRAKVSGTSAKVSVTGTWFIGLAIKGWPVGASFNETLTSPTYINIRVS